jgi:hypothetical protein
MQECLPAKCVKFECGSLRSLKSSSAAKSGIVTTAHGLRIACLGGIYDPSIFSSTEAAPVRFST